MLIRQALGAQAAQLTGGFRPSTIEPVFKEIAERYRRQRERRQHIGMLTDPNHVKKQMERQLFMLLKDEVEDM